MISCFFEPTNAPPARKLTPIALAHRHRSASYKCCPDNTLFEAGERLEARTLGAIDFRLNVLKIIERDLAEGLSLTSPPARPVPLSNCRLG